MTNGTEKTNYTGTRYHRLYVSETHEQEGYKVNKHEMTTIEIKIQEYKLQIKNLQEKIDEKKNEIEKCSKEECKDLLEKELRRLETSLRLKKRSAEGWNWQKPGSLSSVPRYF